MSGNTRKLAVLRARTDRDILVLVQRELDRGFALVETAATGGSTSIAKAEAAYATATSLLLRIPVLSQGERSDLDRKLNDLRARLGKVSPTAPMEWSSAVA